MQTGDESHLAESLVRIVNAPGENIPVGPDKAVVFPQEPGQAL